MNSFDSVLVANRGEIAVRVLRSARDAGYRTIAVYSEADRDAPHVALADEAVLLGPAPASESYLDATRVLLAAQRTGAGAIHPGYGFLSENAAFARACAAAGIVFIGPSAEAIELMGNKAAAKRRMLDAGVPCIPGYQETAAGDEALVAAAADVGYPLMVKAAAGGGGRGMRLVNDASQLPAALAAARSEAENAFGSGELILERALTDARHVELQVFGDCHGNQLHLGERDCSVQRRHQKVIEEAPCPVIHEGLRRAMGDAAVAAAASIGYVGAGTVEFLLDEADDFYFLEMNTRLQVEHPVTELVTGLDLVALQLTVAQGGELPLAQGDIKLRGHAIEARLYAEDSYNDFLPAAGTAEVWEPPTGEGIRVDHGLASGQVISPFYDPMIAKIIAFGEDRPTALRRLRRALDETVIFGLASNREFLRELLARPAFAAGQATTTFIAGEFPGGPRPPLPTPAQLACAALLQHLEAQAASEAARVSADASLGGWSGLRSLPQRRRYDYAGAALDVLLWPEGDDSFRVRVGDEELELALCEAAAPGVLRLAIDGVESSVPFAFTAPGEVSLQWQGAAVALKDRLSASVLREGARGSGALLAPMHGTLLRLLVAEGDWVQVGDEVAVVEAMKMEHRIMADIDGTVSAVHAGVGEQVAAGALLVELVADEAPRP